MMVPRMRRPALADVGMGSLVVFHYSSDPAGAMIRARPSVVYLILAPRAEANRGEGVSVCLRPAGSSTELALLVTVIIRLRTIPLPRP